MTDHIHESIETDIQVPSWLVGSFCASPRNEINERPFDKALRAAQIAHIQSEACTVTIEVTDDILAVLPQFTDLKKALQQHAEMLGDHRFYGDAYAFSFRDQTFLCTVDSRFGGSWDDRDADPIENILHYDHRVSLRVATDQELGVKTEGNKESEQEVLL